MNPRPIPTDVDLDDTVDLEATDEREILARVVRDNPEAYA